MVMFEFAADLLTECETLLDPSTTGRQLPARRYVAHGQPVAEGTDGLLCTTVAGVDVRQVDRHTNVTMRMVTFGVEVWRCWPTGDHDIPLAITLQAVSEALADDCDRLLLGLSDWLTERCQIVEWQPIRPLGPLGGLAGWRVEVSVSMP